MNNKALEDQAEKARVIARAFDLDIKQETSDEYSTSIEFSNGVILYMTQGNKGVPVFYTVGYWDEQVSFVPEFADSKDIFNAMEQVIVLPTMWETHKKMDHLESILLA